MGKIKGYVAEGFEPVRDQLEKMIQSGCEDHLQLCAFGQNSASVGSNLGSGFDRTLLLLH